MKKYTVVYQETRWYSVTVNANDEDDAREVADALVDKDPRHWAYRNEEYEVTELGLPGAGHRKECRLEGVRFRASEWAGHVCNGD